MLSYIRCLGNYCNFSGRSTRREFWGYTIVNLLIIAVFIWLRSMVQINNMDSNTSTILTLQKVIEYAIIVYIIITICPSLAAMCRRWHDMGRTGKWLWGHLILLGVLGISAIISMKLLPYVLICNIAYAVVVFFFYLGKGDKGTNEYGHDPREKKLRRR